MAEESASPPTIVSGFKGLNNRIDPTRLGLDHQLQADNVVCDDAGYLVRRPGIQEVASGYQDIYGTRDGRLLAINSSHQLVQVYDDLAESVLAESVSGAPFHWVELGYAVFVQSKAGTQAWAIYPDEVVPWGVYSSAWNGIPEITYPVGDPVTYPPPKGDVLGTRWSQIVIGVWEPQLDRSVLYFSRPEAPHEFYLDRDFVLLAGKVTLLASLAGAMIVGTDRAIYIDPAQGSMYKVADYGAVLEGLAYSDLGMIWFWTDRGLCKAQLERDNQMSFENITDTNWVTTSREQTTVGLLPWQGSTYAVVHQSGSVLPKQNARPYVPMAISMVKSQGVAP